MMQTKRLESHDCYKKGDVLCSKREIDIVLKNGYIGIVRQNGAILFDVNNRFLTSGIQHGNFSWETHRKL